MKEQLHGIAPKVYKDTPTNTDIRTTRSSKPVLPGAQAHERGSQKGRSGGSQPYTSMDHCAEIYDRTTAQTGDTQRGVSEYETWRQIDSSAKCVRGCKWHYSKPIQSQKKQSLAVSGNSVLREFGAIVAAEVKSVDFFVPAQMCGAWVSCAWHPMFV